MPGGNPLDRRHDRKSCQMNGKNRGLRQGMARDNHRSVRKRAVIFDMDGVIVDSEPLHEQALLQVVEKLGYGANHGVQYENWVGRSDLEIWREFCARHKPAETVEQLLALKRERLMEILRREQPFFEGLPNLIEWLAQRYRLAVASGSDRPVVEGVLEMGGLRPFFSSVVTCEDVQRGKPEPDSFLLAADLLEVHPGECYVIEDSKPGVAAGLAAGMDVIAITNSHPAEELAHATFVVKTYEELQNLLQEECEELSAVPA